MSNAPIPDKHLLFSLKNVSISWPGCPVLQDISLDIEPGEKVAILGKSGAGKTSLLNHLFQQKQQALAFCPQTPSLVPNLSVFHNIFMGQLHRHHAVYNALNLFFPFKARLNEVESLARQVDLADKLMDKAETLSGGQQQRVALARSFYHQKDVFLGDEPVSAVDEHQADALLSLIVASHRTVIIAMHNTRQALRYCDRIIGLHAGAVVLDAPSQSLSQHDLSAFYTDQDKASVSDFFSQPRADYSHRSSVG